MTKKISVLLSGILLLCACGSSVSEMNVENLDKCRISFNVNAPTADAVVYMTKGNISVERENKIKSLDVYVFNEGEKGVFQEKFENIQTIGAGTSSKINIEMESFGKKQFFFIANKGDIDFNLAKGITTAEEFVKNKTLKLDNKDKVETPLLMQQRKEFNLTPGERILHGGAVNLERTMARLDIQNFEPKLRITNVTLRNVCDQSYIWKQYGENEEYQPNNIGRVELAKALLPENPTPIAENAEIEYHKEVVKGKACDWYKHVFYPISGNNSRDMIDAVVVTVEGLLFENELIGESAHKEVKYEKVLKLKKTGEFVGFKRNTRYILKIDNAFQNDIETNFFAVDKWDGAVDINHDID